MFQVEDAELISIDVMHTNDSESIALGVTYMMVVIRKSVDHL